MDQLIDAIKEKQNPCIVGLDSNFDDLPLSLQQDNVCEAILAFNKKIIDAVYDIVPAIKIQLAFYEQYQHDGIKVFEQTIIYAKQKKLLVIVDGKRNDVPNTSRIYSTTYLKTYDADYLTVNPYLGTNSILPFIEDCKKYAKGVFILVKTSNESDIQNLETKNGKVYEEVAKKVNEWGKDLIGKYEYSSIGAVVAGDVALRQLMPNTYFLIPGYGAQGTTARDVIPYFNKDGLGAMISSSRAIIYASSDINFAEEARKKAIEMRDDVNRELNVG